MYLNNGYTDSEVKKVEQKVIGIAGCGGLGSNVAMNLVRMSFTKFIIVDFDYIEDSNLNRQFYFRRQIGSKKCEALKNNLLEINPDLEIAALFTKINSKNINSIFSNCDIVVEALDTIKNKKMFIDNISKDKKIVSGSGLGDKYSVEDIKKHNLNNNFTIIGDLKSDTDSGLIPISCGVNIAAGKQAAKVLEYTIGNEYV